MTTAAAGAVAIVTSAPASATALTASHITSPANGKHFWLTDANYPVEPSVAVTGTSNGTTGAVDIRCYTNGTSFNAGATNVPVQPDGSFSTTVTPDVAYGTCVLRAVPAGAAPGSNVRTFTGPTLTTEWRISKKVSGGPNAGKVYDFYAELQSARAMNDYCSTACGGLWDSRLSYSGGYSSNYLWFGNAVVSGSEPGANRSNLQIDGRNAYLPRDASENFPNNTGFRPLTFSVQRNATTGTTTIRDIEPVVTCSTNTYPPTAISCPHYVGAGVQLERTMTADDGGRQVHVADVWHSTNGHAHTVSAHYRQAIQGFDQATPTSATPVALKLPWVSSAYRTFTTDALFAGPARVPASIYVRDDNSAPEGSLDWPRGALSLDFAPSKVHRADSDHFYVRDDGISVPAGGRRLVRQDFVIGTSDTEVARKAAANRNRINPYRPDLLIKAKASSQYTGNHVYDSDGAHQTVTSQARRHTTAVFDLTLQNDGTAPDSFALKGPGAPTGFSVRYLTGTSGGNDITTAVEHGTYHVNGLAVGASRVIRLVVTVQGGAGIGATPSWLVTARSTHDSARRDAVKARVKVIAG